MKYDTVIIGGGPAGLNAALYAARAGLSCLVLEKLFTGGQMTKTSRLDNYIGFPDGVDAVDLAMQMERQAANAGAVICYDEVTALQLTDRVKRIQTAKAEYEAKTVILAMGAKPRPLGVPGEEKLLGRGVSYCATCDGALYKGKTAVVVGGGDTALEDALFLAKLCQRVYIVHRRTQFRGAKVLEQSVRNQPNIELVLDSVVTEIEGAERVTGIRVQNVRNDVCRRLDTQAVFVAVGTEPITDLLVGRLPLEEGGYVATNETMETALPGVFAAGDLRKKPLRQVITAASDGAVAAVSALRYLESCQIKD